MLMKALLALKANLESQAKSIAVGILNRLACKVLFGAAVTLRKLLFRTA